MYQTMRKVELNYQELARYMDELQKVTYTCKCGHRVLIGAKKHSVICDWCGSKVFKSEKDKFMEIMEKKLNGRKNK